MGQKADQGGSEGEGAQILLVNEEPYAERKRAARRGEGTGAPHLLAPLGKEKGWVLENQAPMPQRGVGPPAGSVPAMKPWSMEGILAKRDDRNPLLVGESPSARRGTFCRQKVHLGGTRVAGKKVTSFDPLRKGRRGSR